MVLAPGDRIGPYEVVAPIGSGGMGDVYRARDPRLGRQVAIKVMGGPYREDPDRLQRFRAEVRTAGGLDHPNVLVVHDVGELDGAPYLVCELLEGQTLKARLEAGPIDRTTALDIALQIARGLTAVHHAGVVHRDLKPANLMLLANGSVKILDFGVARPAPGAREGGLTATGAMIGTVAYMAPEQVRGGHVDARTDLFALGAVLYEMVAGTKAFSAATDVELGYAILKSDPPPLEDPGIDAIVRRCLAKLPGDRYQSAHDLAFALEALRAGTPLLPRRGRRWLALIGALVLAACVGGAAAAGMRATMRRGGSSAPAPAPAMAMTKLSSRAGIVRSARFAPDGTTVVYSAEWNGGPPAVYTAQAGVASAREIVPNAELLAVSHRGDVAVLVKPTLIATSTTPVKRSGTLARTHLLGGALRELAVDVMDADWMPSGELVVAKYIAGAPAAGIEPRMSIEWPLGTRAEYRVPAGVIGIAGLRASPDGSRIAFIQYRYDDQGEIVVLDRNGQVRRLEGDRDQRWHLRGLAWSADSAELFAGLGETGGERCVHALAMSGEHRAVQCAAGDLVVEDRAGDGRMLVSAEHGNTRVRYQLPGTTAERELALSHTAILDDVTADGKQILYSEPRGKGAVYLRDLERADPVRISDGFVSGGVSPDGKWVGVVRVEQLPGDQAPAQHHYLVPTGPGTAHERMPYMNVRSMLAAPSGWLPGSASLLAACITSSGPETCAFGLDGVGRPIDQGIRPGGSSRRAVSPDGKWYLATDGRSTLELVATDGSGERRPLAETPAFAVIGPSGSAAVIGWATDGRAVFAAGDAHFGREFSVVRIDLEDGASIPWRTLVPDDRAGELEMLRAFVIGDGKGYVLSYRRTQSDLYLVEPPHP